MLSLTLVWAPIPLFKIISRRNSGLNIQPHICHPYRHTITLTWQPSQLIKTWWEELLIDGARCNDAWNQGAESLADGTQQSALKLSASCYEQHNMLNKRDFKIFKIFKNEQKHRITNTCSYDGSISLPDLSNGKGWRKMWTWRYTLTHLAYGQENNLRMVQIRQKLWERGKKRKEVWSP